MAAKPPKPPAILLKQNKCNQNNNNNNNNNNINKNHNKTNTNPNTNSNSSEENQKVLEKPKTNISNNNISNNNENENQSVLEDLEENNDKDFLREERRQNDYQEIPEIVSESEDLDKSLEEKQDLNVSDSESSDNINTKSNCNCTNISIMHLFHEMKQKFPTIPDQIVTEFVNENCHRRDNCIQMLNNELALNPIPNQAYPSKILQKQKTTTTNTPITTPTNCNSPSLNLKPSRVAPLAPTTSTPTSMAIGGNLNSSSISSRDENENNPQMNSFLKSFRKNSFNNLLEDHFNSRQQQQQLQQHSHSREDLSNSSLFLNNTNNNDDVVITTPATTKTNLNNPTVAFKNNGNNSTATIENNSLNFHQKTSAVASANGLNNSINFGNNVAKDENKQQQQEREEQSVQNHQQQIIENNLPRVRPTTLNIQTHEQQMQKQALLLQQQQQQHQQQMNLKNLQSKQQQQQHKQPTHLPQKPLRKAPLPPLPPKPIHFSTNSSNSPQAQQNNQQQNQQQLLQLQQQQQYQQNQIKQSRQTSSQQLLIQSQQNSFSTDSTSSCLTSPLSPNGSEISINVSLSSPTTSSLSMPSSASASASSLAPLSPPAISLLSQNKQQQPIPPIRHRSIITVQPEQPYTRDFIISPPTTSSTTNASGKSFTSVNLTLRQPFVANSNSLASSSGLNAQQQTSGPNTPTQSTIDISAGPTFTNNNNNSNGLGIGIGNSTTKGLTYSSSSYNPRLGYQKNFHITVTDEGSVVSATSLRPSRFNVINNDNDLIKSYNSQQQPPPAPPASLPIQYQQNYYNYDKENSYINNNNNNNNNNSSKIISPSQTTSSQHYNFSQQPLLQQEQQQQIQEVYCSEFEREQQIRQQQQQQQQYSEYLINPYQYQQHHQQQQQQLSHYYPAEEEAEQITIEMCYKRDATGFLQKIEKQKERRDALANELRQNKLKKSQLEQEINILTKELSSSQIESLDNEIELLRRECQALSTGPPAPAPPPPPSASTPNSGSPRNHPSSIETSYPSNCYGSTSLGNYPDQQSTQPQPFPRQRPTRSLPHLASGSNTNGATGCLTPTVATATLHRSTTNSPQQSPVTDMNGRQIYLTPQQQQQLLLDQFKTQKKQNDLRLQRQQQQLQQELQQQQQLQNQTGNVSMSSPSTRAEPSLPFFSNDLNDYYTDSQSEGEDEDEEPQEYWTCNLCTFRNHPQLNVCEACENVRVLPEEPFLTRENIHITLSPGENRIIHSWILS